MDGNFDLNRFRVNEELVAVHMDAESMDDAVRQLAAILIEQGYVRPSYVDAALERERTCPTGLPTAIGTAIPHAGVEHTLKPGIAVATLTKPVRFGELGDPESFVDVSIIFMLSVTEPDAQVYLLQSLVNVYKDESVLQGLLAATDPEAIVREVNASLDRVNSPGV